MAKAKKEKRRSIDDSMVVSDQPKAFNTVVPPVPTARPKTRMAIILDRSGSMAGTKKQAIDGLNEQIQQAKEWAHSQNILCSLVTFNGEVFEHQWDAPAGDLKEAKVEDFNPNGSTAMRDAIGYTVQKLLDTDDGNTAYLVYVISDGQTNADSHYVPRFNEATRQTEDVLKDLLTGVQATGRWTITYMGCSKQYLEAVCRSTGVSVANAAVWSNVSAEATSAGFENQKKRMNKYFKARASGQMATACYSSDAPAKLADFTEADAAGDENAPLVEPVLPVMAVDMSVVQSKLPKWTNYSDNVRCDSVFGKAQGVRWTEEARADLQNNHGPQAVFSAAAVSMSVPRNS